MKYRCHPGHDAIAAFFGTAGNRTMRLIAVVARVSRAWCRSAMGAFILIFSTTTAAEDVRRITFVYDAFGPASKLVKDWGFAAFIEYGGRRILFDTGNNAQIFADNARSLDIDLARLDAVVISHRHGDHTSGLTHLLAVAPGVTIYAPREGAFFKSEIPRNFLQPHPGLPKELRYFEGKPPERFVSGSPWQEADFRIVSEPTEIFPGFYLLATRSEQPGTLEMNELSLAFRTPRGLAVVVGCSHPGIDSIIENAARIDPRIFLVTGGFHLVLTPQREVERVADALRDVFEVERVAPAHCTSELGFSVFLDRFRDRFDRAGLGDVIALP
jgi:7,8-dihydropterin-6-yl-methyl-4-(beta-D-ribofuranosyl)aminobenzene 5'-phosphate synthase